MRTIITVTHNNYLPGQYTISDSGRDKRGRSYQATTARGPAAAAAVAMERAIQINGGYVVFGPDDVLALIPADMRERK